MPVNPMNIKILNFGFVFFSNLAKVGVFSFISKWVSDNSHWIGKYPSPINGIYSKLSSSQKMAKNIAVQFLLR